MSLKGSATETANLSALCGKISRVSPYSIDASLTQEGAAAEAKAAGVAIGAIREHVEAHTGLRENPHNVTKRQIGLGDVDNTADIEKPVSNPQQAALDKKVDKVTNYGLSRNDFTDTYRDKLDGIATGANKYSLPVGGSAIGGVKNGGDIDIDASGNMTVGDGKISKSLTVTLAAASWADKAQTVTANGVTASNTVIVSPDAASFVAYGNAQVRCTAQAENSLTFTCEEVPEEALTVNVCYINK